MFNIKDLIQKLKTPKQNNYADNNVIKKNNIEIPNINYDMYLKKLEENNDLDTLPTLFWLCLLRNNHKKKALLNKITNLFADFTCKEYLRVYKLFRERTSLDYHYNFKDVTMEILLEDYMTEEEKINLLGLASFHPNGYIREKALLELSKYNNPKIVPFVIIRINDWVDNIKRLSVNILIKHIKKEKFSYILKNIGLLEKMREKVEYAQSYYYNPPEHILENKKIISGIFETVDEIINNNNVTIELKEVALCKDSYIQEYSLKTLINRELLDNGEVVDILIKMANGFTCYKILKLLLDKMSKEELSKYKTKLEKVRGFKARVLIIDKLYNIDYYKEAKELENDALSKSSTVRYTSRFYMKKLGYMDFIKLYMENLNNDEYKEEAILGLCEVCCEDEIEAIISCFKDNKSKIEKKILNRIKELDNWGEYDYIFIDGLQSKHIGTIKAAKQFIILNIRLFNIEEIYELYIKSNYERTLISAAEILCSENSWTCISYIIEVMGNKNDDIARIGKEALNYWLNNINYGFVRKNRSESKYNYNYFKKPKRCEIDRLKRMIDTYGHLIENSKKETLEKMMNL